MMIDEKVSELIIRAKKRKPTLLSRIILRISRLLPPIPLLFERSRFYLLVLPPRKAVDLQGMYADDEQQRSYTLEPVTDTTLTALAQCRSMGDPDAGIKLFRRRLELGAQGVLLKDHQSGDTMGFAWASVGENLLEDHDRYHIPAAPDQAYIFDTFIHPSRRGSGLYPVLMEGLQSQLSRMGVVESFVTIDENNIASLIAHRRLGAVALERIVYSCTCGITRHTITTDQQQRITWGLFGMKKYCESLYFTN